MKAKRAAPGRPPFLDKYAGPKEKIIRAYQVHQSTRKVAKLVGCANGTVWKVLHDAGIKMREPGITEANRWKRGKTGTVQEWLNEHPSVVLPSRPNEIIALTKCTKGSVYAFLHTLRKRFQERCELVAEIEGAPGIKHKNFKRAPYIVLQDNTRWTPESLEYLLRNNGPYKERVLDLRRRGILHLADVPAAVGSESSAKKKGAKP